MLNKKRDAKRAAHWLQGLLKLNSYSKWEDSSLNRAPMDITTSLDLKSPGIFVGIACASQEETPPCRLYCCFHSLHRSVHVPTGTFTAKLHHITVSLFPLNRTMGIIMSAAALIVTFNLNLNRQATTISSKLRNYFQMFLLKTAQHWLLDYLSQYFVFC